MSAVPFIVAFLALVSIAGALALPTHRRLALEANEHLRALPEDVASFSCGFKARTPWPMHAKYPAGEMKVGSSAIVFRGPLRRMISVRREDTSMLIDLGRMVSFQKYRFVSEPHSVVVYLRFSDVTEVLSAWSVMGWPDPHHHRGLIEGRRGRGR